MGATCLAPARYLCLMRPVVSSVQNVLLLLSLLAPQMVRTGHWLLHHAHHEVLPCSAREEGPNTFHLHDERYSAADCFVCAFWFTFPDLPAEQPSLSVGSTASKAIPQVFLESFAAALYPQRHLRGPPVFSLPLCA